MTCKLCVHFHRAGDHGGQCWRYPPVVHSFRNVEGNVTWEHTRPFLGNDETCGEFTLPSSALQQHTRMVGHSISTLMLIKTNELTLSVRAYNGLKKCNIVYIGDLVQKTQLDLLRIPEFGRKSLKEIEQVLILLGLGLGMEIPNWASIRNQLEHL